MPRNQYPGRGSLDGASDGFFVTPNDTNELPDVPRALWIGTGGDLTITFGVGNILLKNVPGGSLLPIKPVKVLATGTTATDIVGLL